MKTKVILLAIALFADGVISGVFLGKMFERIRMTKELEKINKKLSEGLGRINLGDHNMNEMELWAPLEDLD